MIHACNDDTVVGDEVRVHWIDPRFDMDDEHVEPVVMRTWGLLIHTDDDLIRVAGEAALGEHYPRAITAIPRTHITAIYRVAIWE